MPSDNPVPESLIKKILNKDMFRNNQARALLWLRKNLDCGLSVDFNSLPVALNSAIYLVAKRGYNGRYWVEEERPGALRCLIFAG